MTNSLAISLGLIFTCLIVLDIALEDGAALIYLGRKGLDLLSYVAFWR